MVRCKSCNGEGFRIGYYPLYDSDTLTNHRILPPVRLKCSRCNATGMVSEKPSLIQPGPGVNPPASHHSSQATPPGTSQKGPPSPDRGAQKARAARLASSRRPQHQLYPHGQAAHELDCGRSQPASALQSARQLPTEKLLTSGRVDAPDARKEQRDAPLLPGTDA